MDRVHARRGNRTLLPTVNEVGGSRILACSSLRAQEWPVLAPGSLIGLRLTFAHRFSLSSNIGGAITHLNRIWPVSEPSQLPTKRVRRTLQPGQLPRIVRCDPGRPGIHTDPKTSYNKRLSDAEKKGTYCGRFKRAKSFVFGQVKSGRFRYAESRISLSAHR